ncbi:MAG TPA: double-strand break repair protein AddB [Rhizomicrobium sp.]|nr:double-strand break repair protein AddB [Rhizomicrobium sp.]
MSAPANIFSIPASAPFAQSLAEGLIGRLDAAGDPLKLASATIYLPTRRAVRTLSEAFARVLGGAALLPDIKPLGDVDEDEFLFDATADGFTLPPAIAPLRRRLLLARLIRRWDDARGARLTFAQATTLAASLASLMDEVETQRADLKGLEKLAPDSLAKHWAEVKTFLEIVRENWPGVLEAERAINPADHRDRALRALAARFTRSPPSGPIIAAGSTGSIPATADLLKAIADLPNGMIVLPGLDRTLDAESWKTLDAGHAQYGLMHLLHGLKVTRENVADWVPSRLPAREAFLSEALRPAPTTDAWRARAEQDDPAFRSGLDGIALLEAAHPAEEAAAIALALRETLEQPNKMAALVTPDRSLARRVAAEMGRWNIAIDDSAGRPLSRTPAGTFLCLLVEAADTHFAPVPLLALLKHPFAAMGSPVGAFRTKVRQLDRLCLRGPRPDPGLRGIAEAIERELADKRNREKTGLVSLLTALQTWFGQLSEVLAPLAEALASPEVAISEVLKAHVAVAENLASDDKQRGKDRLWRNSDGDAAANLVAALYEAALDQPRIETSSYAPLFRTLADEKSVRLPFGAHPRLSILGPLEARLQSFDLIVLGGLNEGTWPQAAPIDPWFSRPMRAQMGLEQPERSIGLSAHDFESLASGARVIVTRAVKVEGTPTVASRWLQRIQQLAKGVKADLASASNYAEMAAHLNDAGEVKPELPPRPAPPVEARPRSLSVTEIETWLRDPYAIYARRVLKLEALDPLDNAFGPLERGTVVHSALEAFLRRFIDFPAEAERELIAIGDEMFAAARVPKATLALWRPRFMSAAKWFVGLERERRARILRSIVETRGKRKFPAPGGEFELRGVADRIDELMGGGATIVDYKTGRPPTEKQVTSLLAPQLPLEGAILEKGGFAEAGRLAATDLLYIQFSGGRIPGKTVQIPNGEALVVEAINRLTERVIAFDNPDSVYMSRVMPYRADISGDYDHLARVREWSLSGWQEEDE